MALIIAPHITSLRANMAEIDRLLAIHTHLAGAGPGRKRDVQVLNKSATVLLLACWEAFVEDLAKNSFDHLLNKAPSPNVFPEFVLAIAAKEIKKDEGTAIWDLAGDGWKAALIKHRNKILEKYIDRNSFNTPSPENVDRLLSELFGLTSVSSKWYWHGMTSEKSKQRLRDLIELRGSIAHRVEASKVVHKKTVTDYKALILRLATITHNRAMTYLYTRTKAFPWRRVRYGSTT